MSKDLVNFSREVYPINIAYSNCLKYIPILPFNTLSLNRLSKPAVQICDHCSLRNSKNICTVSMALTPVTSEYMMIPIPRQIVTIKKMISRRLKKNFRIPENPLLNNEPKNMITIKRMNAMPSAYKNFPYMVNYR